MGLDWTGNHHHNATSNFSKMMATFQLANDPITGDIDGELHPFLFASKASQADNPTYEEALNDPHCEGFLHALQIKMKTLHDMGRWHVVDKTPGVNVLPSTWVFKLKWYPDGSVRKKLDDCSPSPYPFASSQSVLPTSQLDGSICSCSY
jgi:hypothetical protein